MLRQQAEYDLINERNKMQTLLDSVMIPKSPMDETVDKVLVTNLFVAYFHTEKYVLYILFCNFNFSIISYVVSLSDSDSFF